MSITGIGSIAVPILTATACDLSIGNKVLYEIIINKYDKYKKQYEKGRRTIKSFDKTYRRSLKDNIIDKKEYESLCNIFTNYVNENKNESYL